MDIIISLILVFTAFLSYIIGRFSHYKINDWLNNPPWSPHHWLYGLIIMLLGFIYKNQFSAQLAIAFGLGFFISDIKDFFKLKIIGPDDGKGKKKFWGFD